jgi:glycosyltransferase involved in cell wall biosynthesis
MNVLQICSKPPLPSVDGGCMATNVLTEGLLKQGVRVKVLTISTDKHPFTKERLPIDYINKTNIESTYVDTSVKPISAFINLFTQTSYNISRFYDEKFKQLIIQNLSQQNYDVILLEGLYVTPYLNVIRTYTTAKIIYRAHNVEYEIWERNLSLATNFIKKAYLRLLVNRLKKYETTLINQVDGIASITNKDKQQFVSLGCKKPIETIPFGITINDYKSQPNQHKNSLFYIGSMDWFPNQEAIKWFLELVLPNIVNQFPQTKFYLAGKSMPSWLRNYQQQNLIVLGEVDNAINFINENGIMVVPLFSGSGMRIKIIEGMALGKPIIATSIAAEGINYIENENILIANTPKEFTEAIVQCLSDKDFTEEIGLNAKKMVTSNYDNKVIVNNLVKFFKHII